MSEVRWFPTPDVPEAKARQWAAEPATRRFWDQIRVEHPEKPVPEWYYRLVICEGVPVAELTAAEEWFDKRIEYARLANDLGDLRADRPAPAPATYELRITRARTTPIPNLSLATATSTRRVRSYHDRYRTEWVPSHVQMLDLLDSLTRPDFAARRWPKVSGAGRWARRWGHEALNSEPRGDNTLRELADNGILRAERQGSMRRYLLNEREACLARFRELFGFTVR